jgi:hypothetical protein
MTQQNYSLGEFIAKNGNGVYVKFVTENLMSQRNFQYSIGVCENTEAFNPNGSCGNGGLYFTNMKNAIHWQTYGSYIGILNMNPTFKYYTEPCGTKFKSDKIEIICFIRFCDLKQFEFESNEDLFKYCSDNNIQMISSCDQIIDHFMKKLSSERDCNEIRDYLFSLRQKKIIAGNFDTDLFLESFRKNPINIAKFPKLRKYILENYEDFCFIFENPKNIHNNIEAKNAKLFYQLLSEFNCAAIMNIPPEYQDEDMCIESVKENSAMLYYCAIKTRNVYATAYQYALEKGIINATSDFPELRAINNNEKLKTIDELLVDRPIVERIIANQHLFFKYRYQLTKDQFFDIINHHGWLIVYDDNQPIEWQKIAIQQDYKTYDCIRKKTSEMEQFAKEMREKTLRKYYDAYIESLEYDMLS